ncbi:hypothetical protein [Flavobacterium sp.]|uniref:hypothetical protein n=1 Tax=Flavobacterium sp. TaxID=239 RepID=UPI002608DF2C|nr:hypothetical protein [Flavobacterium sp.]
MEKLRHYFKDLAQKRDGKPKYYFFAALVAITGILIELSLFMQFIHPGILAERAVTALSIITSLTLLKIITQNGQEH